MTPDQAMAMARFQRPGVKLVVGPTKAREEPVAPLRRQALHALPGDYSWRSRDLRLRLGFLPSLWAMFFAEIAQSVGHTVTDAEWRWLHGPACLNEARAWVKKLAANPAPLPVEVKP